MKMDTASKETVLREKSVPARLHILLAVTRVGITSSDSNNLTDK
jgi:hypothetical protein